MEVDAEGFAISLDEANGEEDDNERMRLVHDGGPSEQAVSIFRRAAKRAAPGSSERAEALNNLGVTLLRLGNQDSDLGLAGQKYAEAIRSWKEATRCTGTTMAGKNLELMEQTCEVRYGSMCEHALANMDLGSIQIKSSQIKNDKSKMTAQALIMDIDALKAVHPDESFRERLCDLSARALALPQWIDENSVDDIAICCRTQPRCRDERSRLPLLSFAIELCCDVFEARTVYKARVCTAISHCKEARPVACRGGLPERCRRMARPA